MLCVWTATLWGSSTDSPTLLIGHSYGSVSFQANRGLRKVCPSPLIGVDVLSLTLMTGPIPAEDTEREREREKERERERDVNCD